MPTVATGQVRFGQKIDRPSEQSAEIARQDGLQHIGDERPYTLSEPVLTGDLLINAS